MAALLGRLHLITDARPGADPVPAVRAALAAGVPLVQVRVGDIPDREAFDLALTIVSLCRDAGAQCLVNNDLHVALAVGADGGHVGADDLPVAAARGVLGPHAILGASVRNPADARAALVAGASYLGVGPVYPTRTKDGLPDPIGPGTIAAIASTVDIPVIAIGGITAARVPEVLAAGAYGVAVVGAIGYSPDPAAATTELLAALGMDHPAGAGAFAPAGAPMAGVLARTEMP